jgi:hypothetical protein
MTTPTTYRYACDNCGHTVTTASPRRLPGDRLVAQLYCPACGEVREVPLGAGEGILTAPLGVPIGPRHGLAGRLAAALARHLRPDGSPSAVSCPVCANADLLLAPVPGREPPCPRCGRGLLVERQR